MEAAEARVDLSRAHLARLGLDEVEVVRGRFAATLDGVLERIAPVDYAFVDGHHDEQATLDYVERITAVASPGAVLVVDDVRWSDGMARAWSRIAEGERVGLAADLGNVGVVVLGGAPRERVAVPLG
jgi:predicted O-methyltransferase YrrM